MLVCIRLGLCDPSVCVRVMHEMCMCRTLRCVVSGGLQVRLFPWLAMRLPRCIVASVRVLMAGGSMR